MNKYSPNAQGKVKKAMHDMKKGLLKSGKSGEKVARASQAIAIGLSEAWEAGGKVPQWAKRTGAELSNRNFRLRTLSR